MYPSLLAPAGAVIPRFAMGFPTSVALLAWVLFLGLLSVVVLFWLAFGPGARIGSAPSRPTRMRHAARFVGARHRASDERVPALRTVRARPDRGRGFVR
jgi:hypothetical protein